MFNLFIKIKLTHNIFMESLWLIFLIVFILFLVIGQVFKLSFSFNVLENQGKIFIKLWCFKIKNLTFKVSLNGIIIRTKNERKQIEYKFNDPQIIFFQNFSSQVEEKVKLKVLAINSNVGIGEASENAIIVGMLNIVYKIFASKIKNAKPTSSVVINSNACFNSKIFTFNVNTKFSLSIFDFLYSLFIAWLLTSKNT